MKDGSFTKSIRISYIQFNAKEKKTKETEQRVEASTGRMGTLPMGALFTAPFRRFKCSPFFTPPNAHIVARSVTSRNLQKL